MEEFGKQIVTLCTSGLSKLLLALVVFLVGRYLIKKIVGAADKMKWMESLDPTVHSFVVNFIKVALYVVLVVSIIGILGVPMASVVTVLASAGVAVGLALQGALSNLAGGIMLLIFRPFNVGDFVITAGAEGVVQAINLFYTVLTTTDNKRVIIPNGALMGANVTNCSSEGKRRVDLVFGCAKGEDVMKVREILLGVMNANEKVLKDPAPFAQLSGGTNEAMEFTTRAWCENADYWDVYFALTQDCTIALGEAGIKAPAVRVVTDKA